MASWTSNLVTWIHTPISGYKLSPRWISMKSTCPLAKSWKKELKFDQNSCDFYPSSTWLFQVILNEPSGSWSRRLSPVSVVLSRWESLTPPGWDTNSSQVSSQQTLVLINFTFPRRLESWVSLGRKRWSHKDSNTGRASIQLGNLWLQGRDLTNCANTPALDLALKITYKN